MIGANLLRYNKEQVYMVVDVETEGLNLVYSRPFQVSSIKFTLDRIIEQKNRYIWWSDFRIAKRAAEVTRFDYNSYKSQAEDPKKVLDDLEKDLYDENIKIVSHNWLGYDSHILNAWRRAIGLEKYDKYLAQNYKVYDTLALARGLKSNIKPDTSTSNNFRAWQYRMLDNRDVKGCSLGNTAKELAVKLDESKLHDALYDVQVNAEIFAKGFIWSMELI